MGIKCLVKYITIKYISTLQQGDFPVQNNYI